MVDKFNTIFVHLRLHWLRTFWRLVHLQKDRYVGALCILAITIWVNLESPRNTVGQESWRINGLFRVTKLREVSQAELAAGIVRYNVTGELSLDLTWGKTIDRGLIQISYLHNKIGAFLDKCALWLLIQLVVQLALELF